MSKYPEQPMNELLYVDMALTPSLNEDDEDIPKYNIDVDEFLGDVQGTPIYDASQLRFLEGARKTIIGVKKSMEAKVGKPHPCRDKLLKILFKDFDSFMEVILRQGDIISMIQGLDIEDTKTTPAIDEVLRRKSPHDDEVLQFEGKKYPFKIIKLIVCNYFYILVDKIIQTEVELLDDDVTDSRTIGLAMKNCISAYAIGLFGVNLSTEVLSGMFEAVDEQYSTTPAYMDKFRESCSGAARADVEDLWTLTDPEVWWELYRHSAYFLIETIRKGDDKLAENEADLGEALNHITSKLFTGTADLFPDADDLDSLTMNYKDLVRDAQLNRKTLKNLFVNPNVSIGQQLLNIMNSITVCDKKSWARHTVCRILLLDLIEGRTSIESDLGEDTQKEMEELRETVLTKLSDHGAEYTGRIKGCVDQFKIVIVTKDGKRLPLVIEVAPNKSDLSAWRKAVSKGADYPTMLDLVRMRVWLVGGKFSDQREVDHALSYAYGYILEIMGSTIPKEHADRMKYHFDQFGGTGGFNKFSDAQNTFKGYVKIAKPGRNKLMSRKAVEVQVGTDFPDHNHDSYERRQFKAVKDFLGANSFQQFTFDLIDVCIKDAPADRRAWAEMEAYSTDENGPAYVQMFMTLLRILLNPDPANFEMLGAYGFMTKYVIEYETNKKLDTIIGILRRHMMGFIKYINVGKVIDNLTAYKTLMYKRAKLKVKRESMEKQYDDYMEKNAILSDDNLDDDEKVAKLREIGCADNVVEVLMATTPEMREDYVKVLATQRSKARENFTKNWRDLRKLRDKFEGLVPMKVVESDAA